MLQLELIVTENGKAQGNKQSLEVAVPISESLERDGEHYVVLTQRAADLEQFDEQIDMLIARLQDLRSAARASFSRWNSESAK